jgi:hypothetical protein
MDSKTFQTFDLGLCSALVSAGYEVIDVNKSNVQKVSFTFLNSPGLLQDVSNYWGNSLDVKALDYFNNLKMLKNRIYSS